MLLISALERKAKADLWASLAMPCLQDMLQAHERPHLKKARYTTLKELRLKLSSGPQYANACKHMHTYMHEHTVRDANLEAGEEEKYTWRQIELG